MSNENGQGPDREIPRLDAATRQYEDAKLALASLEAALDARVKGETLPEHFGTLPKLQAVWQHYLKAWTTLVMVRSLTSDQD